MTKQNNYLSVGLFIIFSGLALTFLAFFVSGSKNIGSQTYTVYASFDNVGSVKKRSSVRIAGVTIGEVKGVRLDDNLQAEVELALNADYPLPIDTSAAILTSGLIGADYIELSPGFEDEYLLADGDVIEDTASAIRIADLISRFM